LIERRNAMSNGVGLAQQNVALGFPYQVALPSMSFDCTPSGAEYQTPIC